MRLQYRDDGGALLRTAFGGTVCVSDDAHHAFTVDLDPYSDNSIDRVDIARDEADRDRRVRRHVRVLRRQHVLGLGEDHRGRRRLRLLRLLARRPDRVRRGVLGPGRRRGDAAPDRHAASQQLLRRVRADEPPLPQRVRRLPHLARGRHGVRLRQWPPRVHGRPRPLRVQQDRQGQGATADAGRQRDLRDRRLEPRCRSPNRAARCGVGKSQGVPNPAAGGSTAQDGPPPGSARRLPPGAPRPRGRRSRLRSALRPPPPVVAVVLPAHAGQRRGWRGRAAAELPARPRRAARRWPAAGESAGLALHDRSQPLHDDARGAAAFSVPIEDFEPSFDGLAEGVALSVELR